MCVLPYSIVFFKGLDDQGFHDLSNELVFVFSKYHRY